MSAFDTVIMVDWSAGKQGPAKPAKDAIWIGVTRDKVEHDPVYCRSRKEAETWLHKELASEMAAGRRVLAGFDFPFGYPAGFVRHVTGQSDPFAIWDWLEHRISDDTKGINNRYEVAEALNDLFDGPGPFWGKSHKDRWPAIPYRKEGITFAPMAERRSCDRAAQAASSCFQLAFPPTVGGQMLMGLPVLNRLRRLDGVRVWPFEDVSTARVVLAEIWPGVIEPAVKSALTSHPDQIRDAVQVRLLARALSALPERDLHEMMTDLPAEAREEAWILGSGHADKLCASTVPKPLDPPPLSNDCFALPPGVTWTPVDEALARLRARLSCVVGQDTVPLQEASGYILAQDLTALRAHPPEPNTAVDGYGFAHESLQGPGPYELTLVTGRAAAGVPFTGTVPPGHALRVLTGAAIPTSVDTVVLEEDVHSDGERIAFHGPVKPRANTRKAGEDMTAGETILHAGRKLTPADLGLMSAVGLSHARVFRRLRVGVLSTGDELLEPGETAAPGQIFDANRPMLTALYASWGFDAIDLGKAPDDRAALSAILDAASQTCDAIVTSGGASAGDEDHVSALLRDTGSLSAWRIALKPGRPLALGLWQGTPIFGLPGNPVAAFVCSLIFARPAFGVLSGAAWSQPKAVTVPAAFTKAKKPGRREYLRARLTEEGAAEVFASEGSGRISGLSWATGLVELPDGAATITLGTPVKYIAFTDV